MISRSDKNDDRRKAAIRTVLKWLQIAADQKKAPHVTEFWVVLDLLEGKIKVPENRAAAAVAWFRENVKQSDDKDFIIKELEKEGF